MSQKIAHRPLSAYGRRILTRLAKATARPDDAGGYRLGAIMVPAALARDLIARDLALVDGEGALAIADPGLAWLRRAEAGDTHDDAYLAQHQMRARRRVLVDGAAREVDVNLAESPLYWLTVRKGADGRPLISDRQFDAGEKLRDDFERAGQGPALTMRWDAPPLSRTARGAPEGLSPGEAQISARRRVETALAAVGPGLSDILVRVCCHHQGMETAERGLGWPQRAGKVVLGIALDRLASHYGL